MRKYVLICNNRRKKILYYYDFRDECVYCIDGGETSKNAEKGARKGGYYGGIIGIFLYPVLGKSEYRRNTLAIMVNSEGLLYYIARVIILNSQCY